jgi:hypothetical protein
MNLAFVLTQVEADAAYIMHASCISSLAGSER